MYGYTDVYGGSIVFIFFLILFTHLVLSYSFVVNSLGNLKNDWDNVKCRPSVMPFAGMIANNPNMSSMKFTAQNFNECMVSTFSDMINMLLKPITLLIGGIFNVLRGVVQSVNFIRIKITQIINQILQITREIINRVLVSMLPVQFIIVKILDTFRKIQGVLAIQVHVLVTAYDALRKMIVVFRDGTLMLLGSISAIMVPLFIFVFTIPFSVPFGAAYAAMAGFLGSIIAMTTQIMNLTKVNVPDKPTPGGCFKKNTLLKKQDGSITSIMNIEVGDVLEDGSIVTEKFIVDAKNAKMYSYKNIVVSHDHRICFRNNSYSKVKDLKDAIPIQNFKDRYIFCLNTNTKFIPIHGILFVDWDDIDDKEYRILQHQVYKETKHSILRNNIQYQLSPGFTEDTPIELKDGTIMDIKDIHVNDVLKDGHRVFAKVELDTQRIELVENELYGERFHTTPNTMIQTKEKQYRMGSLRTSRYIERFNRKMYHLVTDSGIFLVKNIPFSDYNSGIEHYLNAYEEYGKNYALLKQKK